MQNLKKNDTVKVIAGKDKGKTGKVLAVFPKRDKVLVEGINFVKKHQRQRSQDSTSGIVTLESPIDISNVMMVCKSCNRPTRVGVNVLKDGSKTRVCKQCKEVVE